MNFKEASDHLFSRVDHEELAAALGVSVASIRQARLQEQAKAKRAPPAGWRQAMLTLAENRLNHYRSLVNELRAVEASVLKQDEDKTTRRYKRANSLIRNAKFHSQTVD